MGYGQAPSRGESGVVSDSNSTEVLVAGGGLVGAAIAYGLARRGVATIVLDGGDDAV